MFRAVHEHLSVFGFVAGLQPVRWADGWVAMTPDCDAIGVEWKHEGRSLAVSFTVDRVEFYASALDYENAGVLRTPMDHLAAAVWLATGKW